MRQISKATILVVDSDPINLTFISDLLGKFYTGIKVATDGKKALKIAQSDSPPDLILLNVKIPKLDGYEVCKQLKTDSGTQNIPVIFLTNEDTVVDATYGLQIGAVDYITKPITPAIFLSRIKTHLEIKEMREFILSQGNYPENQIPEYIAQIASIQDITIYAMAYLSETRDHISRNHIRRTEQYVKALAEKLRFHPRFISFLDNDYTIEWLYKTAPLHDIGNVGIPDRILFKPGRLTSNEFEVMKSHTCLGRNVLLHAEHDLGLEIPFLKYAKEMAYSHHEKWDGTGYPEGIAGNSIPTSARIMALADVYDALRSRRVYKLPLSHEQAVKIILQGKGTHFDPDMVDAFCEIHKEFEQITYTYPDDQQDFNKSIDYLEQAIAEEPWR